MTDPRTTSLTVEPGRRPRTVVCEGETLEVPASWDLLPPGDAGLTRRVKAGGPTWTVQERRGRRMFSRGVYAPADRIAAGRAAIEAIRADPTYQRRLASDRARREREHAEYAVEFELHVRRFLDFDQRFNTLEADLARLVAAHATPVGSGTVARTKRIPVQRRADAAVIAWMRHQTTGYDGLYIARTKGRRREVRRDIAQRSRTMLEGYRQGKDPAPGCALMRASRPVAAEAAEFPTGPPPNTPEPGATEPPPPEPPTPEPTPEPSSPVAAMRAPTPTQEPSKLDREAAQRVLYEQVRARLGAGGGRRGKR